MNTVKGLVPDLIASPDKISIATDRVTESLGSRTFSPAPTGKDCLSLQVNLYYIMLLHSFLVVGLPDKQQKFASICEKHHYEAFGDCFSLRTLRQIPGVEKAVKGRGEKYMLSAAFKGDWKGVVGCISEAMRRSGR